tara:strand:+ start:156 stop:380 length:225 start_codon:yes stop_codon:yes gene_type:complete
MTYAILNEIPILVALLYEPFAMPYIHMEILNSLLIRLIDTDRDILGTVAEIPASDSSRILRSPHNMKTSQVWKH